MVKLELMPEAPGHMRCSDMAFAGLPFFDADLNYQAAKAAAHLP
jgi:hypothetical protein